METIETLELPDKRTVKYVKNFLNVYCPICDKFFYNADILKKYILNLRREKYLEMVGEPSWVIIAKYQILIVS